MNALVNTNVQTMTSVEIANLTGKRHDNVMTDIRIMLDSLKIQSPEFLGDYKDSKGRTYPCFNLPKRETLILISGYSVELRAKIIDRWDELEKQITSSMIAMPNFSDPVEAARAWADQVEAKRLACKERDFAIETKAHISDKKTATAMATASVKSKEAEKLKEQLGESKNYASVKAVESKIGGKYNWRELKKWCVENRKKIKDIADANYGTVKIYHKDAWKAVYGIKLTDLFST
ncbi:Rha family transcriptional regulator [Acinetobacter haemolyticus]|uniref:Rha family transcriptional regulator n=1 Tax=Acinetobacter haemolyticus TaxID=29430 RepID=UPI00129861B3|nr:Rha family transcriptional regulator [Acinetobacter haemolyticus]MQZ31936.1 Rha family transcriptional regulator [Acinetobacter haemolyticus]